MTDYWKLLEMWRDHDYYEVGQIIRTEEWGPSRVAEFCAYFSRYIGQSSLETLYKFI